MEVLLWEAFTQTVNAPLEQVVLFVWESVSGEEMLQKHRMSSAFHLYPFTGFSLTSFVVSVWLRDPALYFFSPIN